MTAYYNEIDPYAAQWLRNLIARGLIAPGDVDERSIADVRPDDLRGYRQAHFFAGIGGWSVALRLAGWPDDRFVWTGSCPCQPFSFAGAGHAADDSRHLWPAWFPLIAECRPARVFGEQVEAAIGWGWLDAVFADLESQSYSCGTAVLPACGVGAPHIRQRLWFVADSEGGGGAFDRRRTWDKQQASWPVTDGRGELDDPISDGRRALWNDYRCDDGVEPDATGDAGELGDAISPRLQEQRGFGSLPSGEGGTDAREASERAGAPAGGVEHAESEQAGLPGRARQPGATAGGLGNAERGGRSRSIAGMGEGERAARGEGQPQADGIARPGSAWSDCHWLPCTDGKARPVEPGSFPLAHGVQRRASKLRAYGNAIVPQVAAEFIRAAA